MFPSEFASEFVQAEDFFPTLREQIAQAMRESLPANRAGFLPFPAIEVSWQDSAERQDLDSHWVPEDSDFRGFAFHLARKYSAGWFLPGPHS